MQVNAVARDVNADQLIENILTVLGD
jgi:hypothetical protein